MFQDYATWSNFASTTFGPFAKFQTFMSGVTEKLVRKNIEAGSETLSSSVKFMQSMNSSSKGEDMTMSNFNFMSEAMRNSLSYSTDVMNIFQESLQEFDKMFKQNMSELTSDKKGSSGSK